MKDLEAAVKAMTAKQIIMAMVEGLQNPVTKIDMGTYGELSSSGACYGCAATNAVCRITGTDPRDFIKNSAAGSSVSFLTIFESAIDFLRVGYVYRYNDYAKANDFATIKEFLGEGNLPVLRNDYTDQELQAYIELAEYQDKVKIKPL